MAEYNFFRRGGLDQLRIEKPEDLEAVETLDQKLWVALSVPVSGQEFDERTLRLLDTDGDGRIRVPEIVAAVKFVRENFSDFSAFFAGKDTFPLSVLSEKSAAAATAKNVFSRLGKTDAAELSLADVDAATKSFDEQPFNGDGIVIPESAGDDAALAAFITDAVAATGGSDDASGKKGISADQAQAFVKSAADVLAWREKSVGSAEILPLGDATAAAFDALSAVRLKIEDFFARTRLASFDAASAAKLNPSEADFAEISKAEISADASAAFPIARVAATDGEPELPLVSGINPAWAGALADFVEKTLVPALAKFGEKTDAPARMSASLWKKVCALFAPYESWLGGRPAGGADAFSSERLKEILDGNFVEKLAPIFEKDAAESPLRAGFAEAERLCRYSRDLALVLRNFVSFAEFYKRNLDGSAFLVGKLYMDRRTCSLCVRVADVAAHSALAAKSNSCLAYCECTRKNGGEKMFVVAMFGDGDALSLYVGRNGVFYDKKGDDWDAKIVKIVENPISVRQAFWSPYRKLAKFVESQVENFASAREKKVDAGLSGGANAAMNNAVSGTAPAAGAKPAFDVAKFAGIFAAIGLALGAIGAALSVAVSGFLSLAPWQMILAVVAVLLIISAPSMLIAAMKLRRRSLGPILEANGWAINGNVKINIPLGKAFTEMPKKPSGAHTSAIDPYQQKSFPWGKICALVVVLAAAACVLRFCVFCDEGKTSPETAPVATETPAAPAAPAPETPAAPATAPMETPAPEAAPAA